MICRGLPQSGRTGEARTGVGGRAYVCAALTVILLAGLLASASLGLDTSAGDRNCGFFHFRMTLVQDAATFPGGTHREWLLVRGVSCRTARRAVRIYFTKGPSTCLGSGCYGRAGALMCGQNKQPTVAVACSRTGSGADWATLYAVYGRAPSVPTCISAADLRAGSRAGLIGAAYSDRSLEVQSAGSAGRHDLNFTSLRAACTSAMIRRTWYIDLHPAGAQCHACDSHEYWVELKQGGWATLGSFNG